MSYREDLIIRSCDCDAYGRWKPSSVLEVMQETGIAHCDSVGLGRAVTDEMGVVWVLSRCRVELARLPMIGERYSAETFALPNRHLFFPRVHVFRDARGAAIGSALGLWMLMDLSTRRTVMDERVASRLPVEAAAQAKLPGTVRPLPGTPVSGEIVPAFCEFDLNGHVNNTRYMDWCLNAIGFEALRDRAFGCFEINYDREVRRGEAIRTELRMDGGEGTFCGFIGAQRCFGIRFELKTA